MITFTKTLQFATVRVMKSLLPIIALLSLQPLIAGDFRVINKLPERMALLKKDFHVRADTGVTARMRDAASNLNEGLVQMLKDLIRVYHHDTAASDRALQNYLSILEKLVIEEQDLDNPLGERQGTMGSLYAGGAISDHLENRVRSMVESIVLGDADFDSVDWTKRWNDAIRVGD